MSTVDDKIFQEVGMTTEELRKRIKESGNYADLAKEAGVSRQYIYALASGKRKDPSHSVALRIIKALEETSK